MVGAESAIAPSLRNPVPVRDNTVFTVSAGVRVTPRTRGVFYSQGEVEQVCKYVLHGATGMSGSNISIASLENKGFVTYKLPANREYYIFFEVFTNAGVINVSYNNFSKTLHNYKSFKHAFFYSNIRYPDSDSGRGKR